MATKNLPKLIYVAWHDLDNDDPYLSAYTDAVDCLVDDGPTLVGTYKLHGTLKLAKVVKEVR